MHQDGCPEDESLKRRIRQLEALVKLGQVFGSGIRLRENEILELIHAQARELVSTGDMYIALYDDTTDTVRFGLAYVDGKPIDVRNGEGWQPRRAGSGEIEEIIRTGEPLVFATKAAAEEWYSQPNHLEYTGRLFASSLGVPMRTGGKVLGVIAAYHPTRDHAYDGNDLEALQAIADVAAFALNNARLFYDVNEDSKRL